MAQIRNIISGGTQEVKKLITPLKEISDSDFSKTAEYRKEYDGERSRRPTSLDLIQKDKTIGDEDEGTQKTVRACKYRFPFPKKIVRFAAVMLFGGDMVVDTGDKDSKADTSVADFVRLWTRKLRMQSMLKRFARTVKIETKAALLFYAVKVDVKKFLGFEYASKNIIRCQLLDLKKGTFTPHYDETGDMDAFLYLHQEFIEAEDKLMEVFDIYTSTHRFRYIYKEGDWSETPEVAPHNFSVIPVVYQEQDKPDWDEVAPLIDGYEVRTSKLGDQNDYTGDPVLITKGEVELPEKGQVGKVLQFNAEEDPRGGIVYGDAKYLTHDQLPESVKLELEILWRSIHADAPDISLEAMQGVGNIAGASLEVMFFSSIVKAKDDRENFDVTVERCVSVVKNGMMEIMNRGSYRSLEATDVVVNFTNPLPKNLKEYIDILADSVDRNIMSKKTATELHPYVKNADEEFEQLQKEQATESKLYNDSQLESFN